MLRPPLDLFTRSSGIVSRYSERGTVPPVPIVFTYPGLSLPSVHRGRPSRVCLRIRKGAETVVAEDRVIHTGMVEQLLFQKDRVGARRPNIGARVNPRAVIN